MKDLKVILTAALLMVLFSGCVPDNKMSYDEFSEHAIKVLSEKYKDYGDVFTFRGYDGTWADTEYKLVLNSKNFPEDRIFVEGSRKTGEIVDNYTDFLMKGKIEKELTPLVKAIYPVSKVFYIAGGMAQDGLNPSMGVSEYSKANILGLNLTIIVEDENYNSNKDRDIQKLQKLFEEKQYICDIELQYLEKGKVAEFNPESNTQLLRNETMDWAYIRGTFMHKRDSYQFEDRTPEDWDQVRGTKQFDKDYKKHNEEDTQKQSK